MPQASINSQALHCLTDQHEPAQASLAMGFAHSIDQANAE
jgi:hypothetical protein